MEYIIESDGRKREAIEVSCTFCNKRFLKAKRFILEKNYCCKDHADKGRQKRIVVSCAYCGKEKDMTLSKRNKSKTKTYFCNRDCQTAAQTWGSGVDYTCNYKDGKQLYRTYALRTYPNECAECGYNDYVGVLDVHHIDGDRSNNSIDNLIVLCPIHHTMLTRKIAVLEGRKLKIIK